jgi:hypothetical protein
MPHLATSARLVKHSRASIAWATLYASSDGCIKEVLQP